MKKLVVLFFLLGMGAFAQENPVPQKFALVIGNAAYAGSARLKNPVNDANDMAATLQGLGFTVDKVINGSLDDMERAIGRLKNRLSVTNNAYGFFFYAGHGVQSNGVNYLIPVGASISGENYLRERAVSVQTMLAELNDAGNELNVIVLDACRDNPFEWARGRGSGSRGLTVVSNQPADSILVYATSEGSIAADGEGRNGFFTSHLLKNLNMPGLEVSELFRLTGADVSRASGRQQIPAVYNKFFGKAYLGPKPVEVTPPQPVETAIVQPVPMPQPVPVLPITPVEPDWPNDEYDEASDRAARLWSLGASLGTTFSAPWFVGTIHGTLAPFRRQFFELGVDIGFVSGHTDVDYFSLYPFAHYAAFIPFEGSGGFYIGGGIGIMLATCTYNFPERSVVVQENTFAVALSTGIIINNMFNISYNLRIGFGENLSASNTVLVGYIKRF